MKKISLAVQGYLIMKKCPNWDCRVSRSNLICVGSIKPSELSRVYKVKLSYTLGKSPDLIVVDPPLQLNEKGERSPHLYNGNLLCLYHPVKNEWNSTRVMRLCEYSNCRARFISLVMNWQYFSSFHVRNKFRTTILTQALIAETIIPWVSLWLYYYEIWLLTGIWKGGGEHPSLRNNQQ